MIHSIGLHQRVEILMRNQPAWDIPLRCLHILITEEFNTTALLLKLSSLCLMPYIIRRIFCINLYLGELQHISFQLKGITCLFRLASGEPLQPHSKSFLTYVDEKRSLSGTKWWQKMAFHSWSISRSWHWGVMVSTFTKIMKTGFILVFSFFSSFWWFLFSFLGKKEVLCHCGDFRCFKSEYTVIFTQPHSSSTWHFKIAGLTNKITAAGNMVDWMNHSP